MVKICYIILSHENPHHVARLALTLANGDQDGRVVIHYDANSSAANFETLKELVAESGRIDCIDERERCGWGDFSLVQATLNALGHIRRTGGADRVLLISGACLPSRPLADLKTFLTTHATKEFIEVNSSDWIIGGLRDKRYQFYHVLNQRRWRRSFQWMCKIQNLLGTKRTFPGGMVPRFGSQWWALTWQTCEKVLDLIDSDPSIVKFFKTTWIPDELFFQSLVHHLVPMADINNRSLTFYHFNDWGMPLVFLNDHGALVKSLPFYFVRKICHRADGLRTELCQHAINGDVTGLTPVDPAHKTPFPARALAGTELDVPKGHTRLFNHLDPQSGDFAMATSDQPFIIFYGPPALTKLATQALDKVPGFSTLGRLFEAEHIDFGKNRTHFSGLWPSAVEMRNSYPATWLKMVLSRCQGIPAFEISPRDMPEIQKMLAQSSRAIFVPVIPRDRSVAMNDLYHLLLTNPSEIGEMLHARSGPEYIRRHLIDSLPLDGDIDKALSRLLDGPVSPEAEQRSDQTLAYRHGEKIDMIADGLTFVDAALTKVKTDQILTGFPQSVRTTFATLTRARPLFRTALGLDLPFNQTVLDARAKLALRIVKKPK